jgi:uncharacterized protein YacL (UPF0231 family)
MIDLKELYLAKKAELKESVNEMNSFNTIISKKIEELYKKGGFTSLNDLTINSHLTGTNRFSFTFVEKGNYYSRISAVLDLKISKKEIIKNFNMYESESVSIESMEKQVAFLNDIVPFIKSLKAEELTSIVHLKNKLKNVNNKLTKAFKIIESDYFKKEAEGDLSHLFNVFKFLDKETIKQDKKDFYGEEDHTKSFVYLSIEGKNVKFEEINLKYTKDTKRQFTGRYGQVVSKVNAFEYLDKQIVLNGKPLTSIDDIPHITKGYSSSSYATMLIKDYVELIKPLSVSNKINDF